MGFQTAFLRAAVRTGWLFSDGLPFAVRAGGRLKNGCGQGKGRLKKFKGRLKKLSDGLNGFGRGSDQTVFEQFFTQGVAVDAEHIGGFGLVAAALRHHDLEHGLFHLAQHHAVNVGGGFAVEGTEILMQVLLDAVGDVGGSVRHGALVWMVF
ncbi:hypothetical protein HMPREF9120_02163 [Neisseria sp. oral taxon 020 str. F0370]|nr:hypothetical protein HMPREF9120_02163 [Neisseria sp. oral taxon 020 str. F0370]